MQVKPMNYHIIYVEKKQRDLPSQKSLPDTSRMIMHFASSIVCVTLMVCMTLCTVYAQGLTMFFSDENEEVEDRHLTF